MKILVVDDVKLNRELICFVLEDHKFEYCEVGSGPEAIEVFREDPDIDLILMDVDMPGMDGFETTREIKRLSKEADRFVPVIFVTALDDLDILEKCLETGGEDFVPKPVIENVLVPKLSAHQRTISYYKQLKENNEVLSYHRHLMDREHRIIEKIFRNGQQRFEHNCRNIRFHSSAASMFNGDLLLIASNPLGGIYLLLGDFTGHGLAAAVGCMPVTDVFYAMTKKKASVSAIAREMNVKLQNILPDNMFFCAAILELDKAGERLTIWCGGLNDILFVNHSGEIVRRSVARHMPMGILSREEFDDSIEVLTNIRGLRAYVYTDGVIEAEDADKERYGSERFEKFLTQTKAPRIEKIFSEIEAFQGNRLQADDITIAELLCEPLEFSYEHGAEPETITNLNRLNDTCDGNQTLPWSFDLVLTPDCLRRADVIEQVVSVVSSVEFAGAHRDIIFTIVSELFNNALEHGLLQLDSSVKEQHTGFEIYYKERSNRLDRLQDGEIVLNMEVIPGPTARIVLSISDSGRGFNVEEVFVNKENTDVSHARGRYLIESLCEKLAYSDGGRTATITFPLN